MWFTPWYASPMADGGYDVADYRAIDPAFGTLAEAEALIAEALELGIRTIIDIVPNHVSDQHPWFQAALAAGPGSPERARFWFHPGRGDDGDEMPTAGRRTSRDRRGPGRPTRTARPASGTSTCSRRTSPTSTGATPTSAGSTRRSFGSGSTAAWPGSGSTRRRCSSRTRALPEIPADPRPATIPPRTATSSTTSIGAGGRSPTHTRARRILVGEIWLPDMDAVRALPAPRRAAHRLQLRLPRPALGRRQPADVDRQHARRACAGRRRLDLGPLEPRRDPPRHPARSRGLVVRLRDEAPRHADGSRPRATARPGRRPALGGAARLPVHLPGRRAGSRRGRRPAGSTASRTRCTSGPAGPTPAATAAACRCRGRATSRRSGSAPPTHAPSRGCPNRALGRSHRRCPAEPGSMLNLYRAALRIRRSEPGLGDGPMAWLPSDGDVLAFRRGDRFVSVTNMSATPSAATQPRRPPRQRRPRRWPSAAGCDGLAAGSAPTTEPSAPRRGLRMQ